MKLKINNKEGILITIENHIKTMDRELEALDLEYKNKGGWRDKNYINGYGTAINKNREWLIELLKWSGYKLINK